jgi:catechol 2,3-dioxygenase-like lactoylglutathione lyase family enzyme
MAQSLGAFGASVYQVSYIVADLEQAQEFFKRTFGVRSFGRLSLKPRSAEMKSQKDFPGLNGIISLANMGAMELELIQPAGDGWYANFLRRKGPGLHHLGFRPGFRPEDFDAAVGFLKGLGHEPVVQGSALFDVEQKDGSIALGRTQFAYFDLEFAGASCIEISVPNEVFFRVKEACKGAEV